MSLKEKYKWLKHLDFILIDLFCLIVSFYQAYYLKFNTFNALKKQEWSTLFIMLCFINLIVMFCINPYSGILRRRYYLQFRKECALFIYQVAAVCFVFYALKIGTIFSREMMFTMFGLYIVISQPVKYFYKKILNKEFSFLQKDKKEKSKEKEAKDDDIACIKGKKKIYLFVYYFVKRVVDITASIVGIIILIPLTIIVFIFNRLHEEDGPVFYIQERIGKNGKIFKMYKFRSMCVDADEKLERFLEENEDIRKEFYIYRKIKNDPRITKIGGFLRKTSLDEFPQFINLLTGDMSLVGPRPYLEREKEDMGDYYNIIVKDKPGITGLWQINGRSDVTFEDRLKMDLEYYGTKSIKKDIEIIVKTASKVLQKDGAR